jgi:prolyl oligopeptidase
VAWLPEGKGFYYVRRLDPALIPGEEQYHRRVYLHMLGTSVEDDVLIFGAGRQKTQHYTVDSTPDGRWLVLTAAAGTAPRKDVWIADISMDPGRPAFTTVHEGLDARSRVLLRRATPAGGLCYVLTDLAAGRGRLVSTTPADPSPGTWTDLVAQDPEAVLEDVAILDGASLARPVLLVAWTRHAVAEVTVHDLRDGNRLGTVALPPCGSVHRIRAAAAGGTEAWFVFSSFTAPPLVYRFDAGTGTAEPWPVPGLPAGSATARPAVHTRQLVYPSRDGRPVRMFVISATAEPAGPDRPRPTILTGYGGFGHSLTPGYSPEAIAWVAAGGVYAVANLRGGGEEGEDWHRAGMLDQKQNTFDDFHAAADELVATGWSTADTLAIWGVSNGGLLVGAALTQHPEKYAAAVCVAPLLDMRRYERWGMGPSWVSEYGSAADPEQLRWLMAYSPYHHVRDGHPYPAVLLMAFAGDSRVNPVHARKMCAALQAATSSGQPVLYRLERSVGHGIRSTSSQVGLLADMLAFFADRVAAAAAADPPAIRPGQGVRGAAR